MPCPACEIMFYVMPCKYHKKDPLDEMFFPPVKPNRFHQKMMDLRFELLYNDCPCKTCLVRTMCISDFCEEYEDKIIKRALQ